MPSARLGEQEQVGAGGTKVRKEGYCGQSHPGSSGTQRWSWGRWLGPLEPSLLLEGGEDAPEQVGCGLFLPDGLIPKAFPPLRSPLWFQLSPAQHKQAGGRLCSQMQERCPEGFVSVSLLVPPTWV